MRLYCDYGNINFKYAKGKTDIYGNTFHTCYEFYLLLNGKVEFINNHTRQVIEPYQLIIVPPGQYHQFIVSDDIDNYERCVLNIYADHSEQNVLCNALVGKEILALPQSHRIINHFLYLIECISNVNETDLKYILSAVATDIVFLIKNHSGPQALLPGPLHTISMELIRYIDEHYTESLDLDTLSQIFHFSVSSLCHVFKEDFGISIKKYILQKRISAAHMALQRGVHPEEVSAAYGFSTYSTFFRTYKKQFGIPPSASVTPKQK